MDVNMEGNCISTEDWLAASQLFIIAGHYGCGKTEFSINLAIALSKKSENVVLADLDIVNPYFRSREQSDILQKSNVRLITSSQQCFDADIPSIPLELSSLLRNKMFTGVLDIGGDAVGAKVLAQLKPQLEKLNHSFFFVLNANRPLVSTPEQAVQYLRSVEGTVGLPITGIVSNTHLCRHTTALDIRKGASLAERVSRLTGIKVICHVVEFSVASKSRELPTPVFPITLYMKKPWELDSME